MAGRTTTSGYGYEHKKLRRRLAIKVNRGDGVCARCGRPIPAPGSGARCPARLANGRICGKVNCGWDTGHDDHDRSKYTGEEHACCNRGAPGRRKATRERRSTRW